MTDIAHVQRLVQRHSIKQALIIDDAYDTFPLAEDLVLADQLDVLGEELHKRASAKVRKQLGSILTKYGLPEDDFAAGLNDDDFVKAVWELSRSDKIKKTVADKIFKVFEANQTAKRAQLKLLEEFLHTTNIEFVSQGREGSADSDSFQIIFLDLFLGITDSAAALEDAVSRIQAIVGGKPDQNRPLIVVMSTVGSTTLSDLAADLQKKAELLGCKFRAINKEDLPLALPKALTDLLSHRDDAQAVAKWLDGWFDAISTAAQDYRRDMRLLDLSDLAYLAKFRLDVDKTTLGDYLNALSSTYIQFCVEQELAPSRHDKLLGNLKFEKFPASHFLPSGQIPKLKHAASFVNDKIIKSDGYQFSDAKSQLQLGDLIVERPNNWNQKKEIAPEDMPVFVVISQACDIAQGNSDGILLLQGTIRKRDWTEAFKNSPETTDIFIHNEKEYQIEWKKAQVALWSGRLVDQRLRKNGTHLRIGRFREVEALKLQQLFASNLTRVGTIAAPHFTTNVGICITAPTQDGNFAEIIRFFPAQRMAAVMWVRPKDGKPHQLLVFNSEIGERIVACIEALDFTVVKVKDAFLKQVKSMAESPDVLAVFGTEIKLGKDLDLGKDFKVQTGWQKNVERLEKDPRSQRLVMAVSEETPQPGN